MSDPSEYDYSGLEEAASPDDLKELAKLAKQMFEAEQAVTKATKALDKAKKTFRGIAERDIPELMDKCGMKDFTTRTGLHLEVREIVRASITQDNRTKAIAWLDEHGHGGLVKRKVFVDFTRAQEEQAKELLGTLREDGFENVSMDSNVHGGTLGAWVREQLKNGASFPEKLFGVHKVKQAKISTK